MSIHSPPFAAKSSFKTLSAAASPPEVHQCKTSIFGPAIDEVDGNISFLIDTEGSEEIDTSKAGEHVVTYNVSDFSGNKATTVTRTVKVVESNPFNTGFQTDL